MCVNSLIDKQMCEKGCQEFGGLGFLYIYTHTHNLFINKNLMCGNGAAVDICRAQWELCPVFFVSIAGVSAYPQFPI